MELIKQVCVSHNVAALVVIHQPNGYVFETFDQLNLLSSGNCIFSDSVKNLPSLYNNVFQDTMPLSTHEIPVDLLKRLTEPFSVVTEPTDLVLSSVPAYNNAPKGLGNASGRCKNQIYTCEATPSNALKFSVVFHRNLLNHYIRNKTNLAVRVACYAACSVLDGCIYWQIGSEDENETNAGGPNTAVVGAFTFILLLSYLLPFGAIPLFVHDKKFFLYERCSGLYSPWIYCLSLELPEMWALVYMAVVEAIIMVPMCGLWNPSVSRWESFLMILSGLIVSGLTGNAMVLFSSVLVSSQDLAFLLAAGLVCFSLGMSGGFVAFPLMRDFISWLQWLSPVKYSLQALSLSYLKGSTQGEAYLDAAGLDQPETAAANLGVLLAFYGILACVTILVLSKQREVR
jgi:hypothetical protein